MTLRDTWYDRDGVKLHAVEAGPADGPLYILLHGFPEFWYGWRKQISPLADAGFHVVVPDQRGYNLSDKPRGARAYRMSELTADILHIANGRRFRVAGHDWGGAVAWMLSLSHPEAVEKLAILNVPHPVVMMRHMRTDPGQLLRSWYMFFFQVPGAPEAMFYLAGRRALANTSRPGTFSEDDLRLYESAWSQPGCVTGMINWYRALMRARPPQIPDPVLHMPVTIVWGRQDKFLKPELAAESAEFCPQGQLVYLDNATHWVQHEEPERVNELLLG